MKLPGRLIRKKLQSGAGPAPAPESEKDAAGSDGTGKNGGTSKLAEYLNRTLLPYDLPPDYKQVVGADPTEFFVLCKNPRGNLVTMRRSDRIHMAVFGLPGSGKSTFMLLQIIQNIRNNEGFILLDPHGDLARKVLAAVPREKWDRVIYIDPNAAAHYRRTVKIALLETPDPSKKGVVAMSFVDSLKKMYEDSWGPRLERILLNAVYAVMEQEDRSLSRLYDIMIDPVKREMILANVRNEMVLSYWTNEFPLLKDDAPTAVTNKICRLIQEEIVAPLFDCSVSSFSFKEAMDEGKFIIVNLSEGRLTTEVANFLGALILNKVYQEGMAREDQFEEDRRPFFVYVDEAYRFVTSSIKDILQALRKYKVYMTLAAQYLDQFSHEGGKDRTITKSIPHLCDTIVTFAVGAETAAELEPFFKPVDRLVTKEVLTTLQKHEIVFSSTRGNERIVGGGICIDATKCTLSDPEEVIKHSLEMYGTEVNPELYRQDFLSTPVPDFDPVTFAILSYLFYKRDCKLTSHTAIVEEMKKYGFPEMETNRAINALSYDQLLVKQYAEELVGESGGKGKQPKKKQVRLFSLSEIAKSKFRDVPNGQRGGGVDHVMIIGRYVAEQRQNGFYCIVDRGASEDSLPDIIVFPPQYSSTGRIHPRMWNYAKKFAVEVEIDPIHHPDRVLANWEKCLKYGMPVNFITTSLEGQKKIAALLYGKTKVVKNLLKEYAPGYVQIDRATASGEIIRAEEDEAAGIDDPIPGVEANPGAPATGGRAEEVRSDPKEAGGQERTQASQGAAAERADGKSAVMLVLPKLRDAKTPEARFDLLLGEGWRPHLHPREGYQEVVFSPPDGAGAPIPAGRYEGELKRKYDSLAASQRAPAAGADAATGATKAGEGAEEKKAGEAKEAPPNKEGAGAPATAPGSTNEDAAAEGAGEGAAAAIGDEKEGAGAGKAAGNEKDSNAGADENAAAGAAGAESAAKNTDAARIAPTTVPIHEYLAVLRELEELRSQAAELTKLKEELAQLRKGAGGEKGGPERGGAESKPGGEAAKEEKRRGEPPPPEPQHADAGGDEEKPAADSEDEECPFPPEADQELRSAISEVVKALSSPDGPKKVAATELYERVLATMKEKGVAEFSMRRFGDLCKEMGLEKTRSSQGVKYTLPPRAPNSGADEQKTEAQGGAPA